MEPVCHWFRRPITSAHKKEWFDNATDNLSTRLFYREEWLDNRKSIYRVTEGTEPPPIAGPALPVLSPSLSYLLSSAFTDKPKYYKRLDRGCTGFSSFRFSPRPHNGGSLFPRRIIFSAKSPAPPGDRFLFLEQEAHVPGSCVALNTPSDLLGCETFHARRGSSRL